MNLTLITHLIAAAVAAAGVWVFQDARMDAAVADVRLEQSDERLRAVSTARANERAISKTYQGALNEARVREAALRRDFAAADLESGGLRDQLSEASRRIAAAPPGALIEYASTVNQLLAECSRSYQELAGAADGHAADARTLSAAWPVVPPSGARHVSAQD